MKKALTSILLSIIFLTNVNSQPNQKQVEERNKLAEGIRVDTSSLVPYLGKNQKFGYIDYYTKKLAIPCLYDSAFLFDVNYSGKAHVVKGKVHGYIDHLNNFSPTAEDSIDAKPTSEYIFYANSYSDSDSNQTMRRVGDKYAYFNWEEKQTTEAVYENYIEDCSYDVMILKKNKKYGIVGNDGVIYSEFIYDSITCDGIIKKDNKYGILKFASDKTNPFKTDVIYDSIINRNSGQFYYTIKDKKWGLCSSSYGELFQNIYDCILISNVFVNPTVYYIYPLTIVKKGGKFGAIKLPLSVVINTYHLTAQSNDDTIKEIQKLSKNDIPFVYDSMSEFREIGTTSNGLFVAFVTIDNKGFYIDESGNEYIEK